MLDCTLVEYYLKRKLLTSFDGKTLHHLAIDAQSKYVIGYFVVILNRCSLGFVVEKIEIVSFHNCRVYRGVTTAVLQQRLMIHTDCYETSQDVVPGRL
jgi:hypothetical protein